MPQPYSGAILYSGDAIYESGLPIEHARCFQDVSDAEKCVILLRSVGRKLTGLLKEGYATKSFHIKSKSCAWGPMAGFVCVDPRFSKSSITLESMHAQTETSVNANLKGKIKAFVPIMISTARLDELENNLKLIRLQPATDGGFVQLCEASGPEGRITFKLFYDVFSTVPVLNGYPNPCYHPSGLWKIKYHSLKPYDTSLLFSMQSQSFRSLPLRPTQHAIVIEPDDVLSFVTIMCPDELMGSHRSATISDYDLFSIFPAKLEHDPKLDTRIVPGSFTGAASSGDFAKSMDKEKGNTTERVVKIINSLNEKINYAGGIIVHHGDEAGRPGVTNIDYPFIGFIPHVDRIPISPKGAETHLHDPQHYADPEHSGGPGHVHGPEHQHGPEHEHKSRVRRRKASDPTCYFVRNLGEFKFFISKLEGDFVLNLNPGWLKELGISQSLSIGSFDIK